MVSEHVEKLEDAGVRLLPALPAGSPDPLRVREQCERILADPLFSHSKRCTGLLRYIVEHTLNGESHCLKERILGIEVFGRPADYSTGDDATVRVAINELRKRLSRYYEDAAHAEELRIDLPQGSYVARFRLPDSRSRPEGPEPAREQGLPDTSSRAEEAQRLPIRKWYFALALTLAVVVFAVALFGVRRVSASNPLNEFWAPLLEQNAVLLITMGQPVQPNPSDRWHSTPVAEYISRQGNFPIAELNAANSISSFAAAHGTRAEIRLASSATQADMVRGPVVVLGSYLNELAMQHQSSLRFQFRQDDGGLVNWISDSSQPGNRAWAVDFARPLTNGLDEYAVVTRDLDPTTHKWRLGIGGATVLGTIAAQHLLLDGHAMTDLNARLPSGWDRKNLQIVLGFKMADGGGVSSRVLATQLW